MEFAFADDDLCRIYTDLNFNGGFDDAIVNSFRRRMQLIASAADERDFYALKSAHFEKLKGDMEGLYSMRLNDQWRLLLKFKKEASGKVLIVISIIDYH